MKIVLKVLGIAAIVAIIGFAVACDGDGNNNNNNGKGNGNSKGNGNGDETPALQFPANIRGDWHLGSHTITIGVSTVTFSETDWVYSISEIVDNTYKFVGGGALTFIPNFVPGIDVIELSISTHQRNGNYTREN